MALDLDAGGVGSTVVRSQPSDARATGVAPARVLAVDAAAPGAAAASGAPPRTEATMAVPPLPGR